MPFIKYFSTLAVFAACCTTVHAQNATPTSLEALYNAVNSRIDNLVSQNASLNDNYAKLLACSRLKMFYSPDTSGADAQGCVAGTSTSTLSGGGGKWAKIGCPGESNGSALGVGSARDLPDCPSDNMQGQACSDVGQRCKIASSPVMNCHYDIHVNGQGINGFVCR
jgi:hypothetical protein